MLDSASYGVGRTHEPVLVSAVAVARPGPVLELGAGYFSTPLLSALCRAMKRTLITVEGDKAWAEKFRELEHPNHLIYSVANWDEMPVLVHRTDEWSVIFVDHAPAERRIVDIAKFADKCEFMVIHDTEHPLYDYEPTLAKFKHRYDYKKLCPWTSVVSNVRGFPEL